MKGGVGQLGWGGTVGVGWDSWGGVGWDSWGGVGQTGVKGKFQASVPPLIFLANNDIFHLRAIKVVNVIRAWGPSNFVM